jgi:hypothetical protein
LNQVTEPCDLRSGKMALMIDGFQDVRPFRLRHSFRVTNGGGHGFGVIDQGGKKTHTTAREAVKGQRDLPEFIEGEYGEAQVFAEKALKSFRAGEIRKTKALFWAANAYHDRAQRDATEVKELNGRIAELLGRERTLQS